MVKITKRVVEAEETREKDYVIWDDELPGFGLRVFSSGKRSYVIQYRIRGRSRRYTTCESVGSRRRNIEYWVGCSATLPSRKNTLRPWTSFASLR